MEYQAKLSETNAWFRERCDLVMERLEEIAGASVYGGAIDAYFSEVSQYLLLQKKVIDLAESGQLAAYSGEEGKMLNDALYARFAEGAYESSFANPAYAVKMLGEQTGTLYAALYSRIEKNNIYAFEGNLQYACIYAELLVELYNCYADADEGRGVDYAYADKLVKDCVVSFMHDYSEVFNEERIARLFDAGYDYDMQLLMDSDLQDAAFLYRYGLYVGENEIKSLSYLNTFSDEQIQAMADTYTEGYRIGFEVAGKNLAKKTTAELRYPLGFERMVRKAVENFGRMNLKCVLKPFSTSVNKQYDFDHKEDAALWLDKAYVERSLECYRYSFEQHKEIAAGYAGPAVIEVFGEAPFSPVTKKENARYSEKQQPLCVDQQSRFSQLLNQYIHGEERSFTIIAYPVPEIGGQYEDIFAETVRINTLDYVLYRDMQQKLIDVLDTAERVHITGANGNKTDLYVQIHKLENPDKETAFENCVADVNIPVGEVFTSPVLAGTNGKLFVSQVYLNGLNYENLEIDFADGMIQNYTCTNFENEEENRAYIADNVLMHHATLPMGEFAIGTNTTAYRMARTYGIADKLPILIAEKTGPHFAVGDTCYTYDEDNMTYNPDGKAIVARDNERSILRKEDISKAYFNCHTDITIPYDELGAITVLRADGTKVDIIRDGRFVVPGTELLNQPLDEK